MQNRYVGDVGDFAKYALLRSILRKRKLRLGVIWCLFNNETHNSDGRHTNYLERGLLQHLDPSLHDQLRTIVLMGQRSVSAIEGSGVLGEGAVFYGIPSDWRGKHGPAVRTELRARWVQGALNCVSECDLVFFDPDNGLQTPSVPIGAPKSGKYVFWHELDQFWRRGQSLVVYHHTNRTMPVKHQTLALEERFASAFPDAGYLKWLLFRRGSCRHFWIVGQQKHKEQLSAGVDQMLASGWDSHFDTG